MRILSTALTEDGDELVLSPEVERRAAVAAARVARRTWNVLSGVRISFGLVFGAIVFIAWEWADLARLWLGVTAPLAPWQSAGALLEMAKAGIPTVLTVWLLFLGAAQRDRGSRPSRLYCRWHGRQAQGICAGLGEYFQVPPWMPRTAFMALMLLDLGGVSAYAAAALGLAFHPDDREHMLRFRIRRFLLRRRGITAP